MALLLIGIIVFLKFHFKFCTDSARDFMKCMKGWLEKKHPLRIGAEMGKRKSHLVL